MLDVSAHLLLLSDSEAEMSSRIPLVWGPRSPGIPPQYKRALLWPPDHHSFCYGEGVSEILPEYVNVYGTVFYSNDNMVNINTLLDLVICFCKKEKETTKITSKYYTLCFLMSPRYYEDFSQLEIMIIISILRSQLDSFLLTRSSIDMTWSSW